MTPRPTRQVARGATLASTERCAVEGHCITCSDEGVRMRVVALAGEGVARCADAAAREWEVLTGLLEPVGVGDVLLVHAGAALARLKATEGGQR